jgi:hypothetical protein
VVIPKVSPPQDLDQLRNLGLTQFFSKVLESVIVDLLKPYLKDDIAQFGGKKLTGTSHYLIELTEFIMEGLETGNHAIIMLCADFSKGFNRIHPMRLITTLADMGIPGYLLNIIISYMTNRRMKVKYNQTMSDEQPLPGGSPQGSLLSVIIFCIYTSGCGMKLKNQVKEASPDDYPSMPFDQPMRNDNQIRLKYIDDTSLAAKIALEKLFQLKDEKELPEFLFDNEYWEGTANPRKFTNFEMTNERNTVHEMIDDVNDFVRLNYMRVNEKKTKIMLFNNNKNGWTC